MNLHQCLSTVKMSSLHFTSLKCHHYVRESEQMAVAFVDSQVLANDDFFLNSYYIKIKAGQTSKSIFFLHLLLTASANSECTLYCK